MAHDKDDKLRRLPHALLRRSPIIKSTRGPELGGTERGLRKTRCRTCFGSRSASTA